MALVNQHPSIGQQKSKKSSLPIADSSYLENVDYDPTSLQMTVTMKSGAQYQYFYVYPHIFEELMKAPSKGKFYAEQIRSKMPSTRLVNKNVGKAIQK